VKPLTLAPGKTKSRCAIWRCPATTLSRARSRRAGSSGGLAGFSLNIPPEECDLSRVPAMEIEPFSALLALDRSDTLDKALQFLPKRAARSDAVPDAGAPVRPGDRKPAGEQVLPTTRARINPKSEIRNPKQITKLETEMFKTHASQIRSLGFRNSDLFRISDFGFRIFCP